MDATTGRTHSPGGVPELLVIALPMVVSSACETMMIFVDRLFLAQLGPQYMSAAMGGGLTCFMFMTFFLGLTGYGNALVAQNLGAGRKDLCALAATQGLIVAVLAWPVVLACVPVGELMFRLSNVAPEQLAPQIEYYRILMMGAGLGLLRSAMSAFFSGIGRTRPVMVSATVAMAVNLSMNYVLIFGRFGFPALGIRGAAIGTICGSFAGLVVLAIVYVGKRNRAEFGIVKGLRFDRGLMKKLWLFGSPSGAEFMLNILAFNLIVLSFHSYGVDVAAAITITFSWNMVSFIPLLGVGIGVMSLVGRYMGAGKPDVAHRVAISGLKLATLYSLVCLTAFGLFPELLVSVFSPDESVKDFAGIVPLAVFMLRLVAVYVFADAVSNIFGSALRGAGDTFWTMVISVVGHWALALAAIFMIRVAKVSPRAAWGSIVFLVVGLGLAFYVRYRSGRWRTMHVVEPPAPMHQDSELNL
jgi:MATE family multidrug resistance protein